MLLHEGLGCIEMWRDWPDQLVAASGCSVLAYSRWGYGGSDPVTLPRPIRYMHDEALDALPEVLSGAGVKRCVLVGHSDGGSIALIHAGSDRCAASVEGLVLLAPHVFCEAISVQSIEGIKQQYQSGGFRARLERYHHANVDGAFWGWNGAWLDPAFLGWNIEGYLPAIRVPVTVVQGATDPYGTLEQVDRIERGLTHRFTRRVLPDCGHSPYRDQPGLSTAAVVEQVRALGQ